MNDPYIGTQITLSSGSTLKAIAVHHVKNSRKYYTWECSVCSKDSELWPEGSIVVCKYGAARNCPCGCNKVGRYSQVQMEVRATRLASKVSAYFLGWVGEYKGNVTKCFLVCEKHGVWETCSFKDLAQGKGCPACAKVNRPISRRLTLDYCEVRARKRLAVRGWEYFGLCGTFKGGHSRIAIKCPAHGVFESTFHYANQGNTGCMKCALSGYGFDQNKPAVLYALRSECGGYTKIGVSTNFDRRVLQLRSNTPFKFSVFGTWLSNGTEVLRMERWFHSNFETAGLAGFEGHSEWIKHNPEALTRFTQLTQGSFQATILHGL